MGKVVITTVIQAIDAYGIAAQRARPAQKAVIISRPVAAVCLQAADLTARTISILVTILSPMDRGAQICEDVALDVADMLYTDLNGACTVGCCESDERAGVFSVPITAVFTLS